MLSLVAFLLLTGSPGAPTPTPTGKVPLEGMLAANNQKPAPGEVIQVYFNVTTLRARDLLTLEIRLPAGLESFEPQELRRSFRDLAAGQTSTLTVPLKVVAAGEIELVATATELNTPAMTSQRSFVLFLNPARASETGKIKINAKGEKEIVFGGPGS